MSLRLGVLAPASVLDEPQEQPVPFIQSSLNLWGSGDYRLWILPTSLMELHPLPTDMATYKQLFLACDPAILRSSNLPAEAQSGGGHSFLPGFISTSVSTLPAAAQRGWSLFPTWMWADLRQTAYAWDVSCLIHMYERCM